MKKKYHPSEIVLSHTSFILTYLGETTSITATVLDQFGGTLDSEPVVWNVSDSTCATVDENGVITAINNGQTLLTAEFQFHCLHKQRL